MNKILVYFALKYNGDFDKIFNAITSKEKCDYDEVCKTVGALKCKYTTIIASNYPTKLKRLSKPPFVLFYYGDLSLIDKKTIGVIGSRNYTKYGEVNTNNIIEGLVYKNYIIVSGLAKGIDSIAHKSALLNLGKTIAVLGNGVDYFYPINNLDLQNKIKEEGLLISEYPPSLSPKKENFPKRNRIIAAISDSLIVIEAKRNSGTMITVNEALNLGKDIMCIPTRNDENSGCNYLIKSGAFLIEDINDVLEILNEK